MEAIKDLFKKKKNLINIGIILILILGLGIGIYLARNPQILRGRALDSPPIEFIGPANSLLTLSGDRIGLKVTEGQTASVELRLTSPFGAPGTGSTQQPTQTQPTSTQPTLAQPTQAQSSTPTPTRTPTSTPTPTPTTSAPTATTAPTSVPTAVPTQVPAGVTLTASTPVEPGGNITVTWGGVINTTDPYWVIGTPGTLNGVYLIGCSKTQPSTSSLVPSSGSCTLIAPAAAGTYTVELHHYIIATGELPLIKTSNQVIVRN